MFSHPLATRRAPRPNSCNTAVYKLRAEDIAFQATKEYGGVVLSDAESDYRNGSDFLMAAKVRLPYDCM